MSASANRGPTVSFHDRVTGIVVKPENPRIKLGD
jgi:hypothetical protein